MHPDAAKLLWDAVAASERVERFVGDADQADYVADELMRAAVERQLEIVGEALSQLAKLDNATSALVPELPRIVGLRNQLVHAYSRIDSNLIWSFVKEKLPLLKIKLKDIIQRN